jgi:hypothetical protein
LTDHQSILDFKQLIETLLNQQKDKLVEEAKTNDVITQNLDETGNYQNGKSKNEQLQQNMNVQGDLIHKRGR